MRILMLDLDTLRPDHLGCYGYHRNTSPALDRIAAEGLRFDNYYVSDAPCLPSRSALLTGRFGIHNAVVNHGGTNADPPPEGPAREFKQRLDADGFFGLFRRARLYTASISPFGERHSAWQFYAGLNEMLNPAGRSGHERADEILPTALDWLDRNRGRDNWFLHVNLWDPHTPYRTPEDYGNPFENDPIPDWMTQDKLDRDRQSFGTHSAADLLTFTSPKARERFPRLPADLKTLDDFGRWIDGYDTAIRYMDDAIGRILAKLEEQGLLDQTVIIVTSDHGENQGELNVYGDHQTADQITSRVPMLIRWPGVTVPGSLDSGLHYQIDLLPTLADVLKVPPADAWDGQSYAAALAEPNAAGRQFLVLGQMTWSCQRAVRWDRWMLIRTYHAGLKDYPPVMLFDVAADPHELHDLAAEQPEIVAVGLALLEQWHADQMACSPSPVDPMQTVLREGGPYHTRTLLARYCAHLRSTGRAEFADRLEADCGDTNWA